MKKKIWISAAVAAVGAGLASAYLTTHYLVNLALDRQTPRKMEQKRTKLKGSSEQMAFLETIDKAAQELEAMDLEEVQIVSRDGIRLVGHWYPCEGAKRVLVAMHGWRSSWARDFGTIADFWHRNGCSILFAEQRGQNNSGGDYMGFGLLERYDCLEWVHWVNRRAGKELPVYLAGVSMGATTVLMTAGLTLPKNVRGIMADCGFTSPRAIWKHVVENNLHIPYGLYSAAANDLCRRKIRHASDSYSVAMALRENKRPIIFVHGTEDSFVPVEMTYENYKSCHAPKRLVIVPGADHGMSYYTDPVLYESETLAFWGEYD